MAHDDYLSNDPNKGVPIADLLKKHGGFTAVIDKKDWFDETAKPKKKSTPESEFEPDPDVKEEDGKV